ncbi:hypothetical protein YPPY71_1296, partial [Yersinia pestis PY-71]
MHDNDGISSHT